MTWLTLIGSLALSQPQSPLVFPASAELVHVVVSVTNEAGEPIRGLHANDFKVGVDGKRRPVVTLASCVELDEQGAADCPVDMVLLLDTSTSMKAHLRRARDAAVEFAKAVPAARGRRIISFDSALRRWPYVESDPGRVLDEILDAGGGGATRLFDAVRDGIGLATQEASRRPVIVALTDGEDSGASLLPGIDRMIIDRGAGEDFRDILQSEPVSKVAAALQAEAVSFYAIAFQKHFTTRPRREHAAKVLKDLAKATGGLVADGDAENLNAEFARIRNDLSAQYVLGFEPAPSPTVRLHKLKVEVTRKGAKVRHRLAYETKNASTF